MPQSRVFDPILVDFVSGCPVLKSALQGGKKFSETFVNLGGIEALFYWVFEGVKVDKKTRKVDRNDVFDVACQPNVNPLSTLEAILSTKCQPKCNPDATLSARSGELTEGIVGGAHVDFASLPSKHVSS